MTNKTKAAAKFCARKLNKGPYQYRWTWEDFMPGSLSHKAQNFREYVEEVDATVRLALKHLSKEWGAHAELALESILIPDEPDPLDAAKAVLPPGYKIVKETDNG